MFPLLSCHCHRQELFRDLTNLNKKGSSRKFTIFGTNRCESPPPISGRNRKSQDRATPSQLSFLVILSLLFAARKMWRSVELALSCHFLRCLDMLGVAPFPLPLFAVWWGDRHMRHHTIPLTQIFKVKLIPQKYFFAFVLILIGQMIFHLHVYIDTSPRICFRFPLS